MRKNKSDKNGLHITHIRGGIKRYWYNKWTNKRLKNIRKIIYNNTSIKIIEQLNKL